MWVVMIVKNETKNQGHCSSVKRSFLLFGCATLLLVAVLRGAEPVPPIFNADSLKISDVQVIYGPALNLLTTFVLSSERPTFWRRYVWVSGPVLNASTRLQLANSYVASTRPKIVSPEQRFEMELQTLRPTVRPHKFDLSYLDGSEALLSSADSVWPRAAAVESPRSEIRRAWRAAGTS